MHYHAEWKESEARRGEEKTLRLVGFLVKHGNQNLLVPFADMLGFYVEDGYTVLYTRQNRKYFPGKSLDKIEALLPGEFFFRLNRQYILHRNTLAGYKRTGDGKLDVMVQAPDSFPTSIAVSRTRAVTFKTWFQMAGS